MSAREGIDRPARRRRLVASSLSRRSVHGKNSGSVRGRKGSGERRSVWPANKEREEAAERAACTDRKDRIAAEELARGKQKRRDLNGKQGKSGERKEGAGAPGRHRPCG